MQVRKTLAFLVMMGLLAGCNLPSRTANSTPTISPVNVTITALYQTAMAVIPSQTPVPASATPAHQVATSTAIVQPPSNTATKAPVPATAVPATAVPATPVPPTKAAPTEATLPEISAARLTTAPVLDGDWAEWKKVAREYPAQYVVYGKANRSGEDDLNASYYVGWDTKYLYIAVKVRDDVYVQMAKGANIYKGDSIELLLDTNRAGDLGNHTLSADDYQIGIAAGSPMIADDNPEVYRWYPAGKAGSITDATVAAVQESGVYRVEAAIPWSALGVTPVKGMKFGFALSVSDDDIPGKQVQESMVSSVPARKLTDPDTWGVLVLK